VHTLEAGPLHVLAGHALQVEMAAAPSDMLNVPAGHDKHEVGPTKLLGGGALYVPAEHNWHVVALDNALKVPAAHFEHCGVPIPEAYFPGSHLLQEPVK
jgi:hypothetical protein